MGRSGWPLAIRRGIRTSSPAWSVKARVWNTGSRSMLRTRRKAPREARVRAEADLAYRREIGVRSARDPGAARGELRTRRARAQGPRGRLGKLQLPRPRPPALLGRVRPGLSLQRSQENSHGQEE